MTGHGNQAVLGLQRSSIPGGAIRKVVSRAADDFPSDSSFFLGSVVVKLMAYQADGATLLGFRDDMADDEAV